MPLIQTTREKIPQASPRQAKEIALLMERVTKASQKLLADRKQPETK